MLETVKFTETEGKQWLAGVGGVGVEEKAGRDFVVT